MNRFVIPVPERNVSLLAPICSPESTGLICETICTLQESVTMEFYPFALEHNSNMVCMDCEQMGTCSMTLEKVYPKLQPFDLSAFIQSHKSISGMLARQLMTIMRDSFETIIGEHSGKRRP